MNSKRPRFSDVVLPAYSYVPGMHPHPVSDVHGHSYSHDVPLIDGHSTNPISIREQHLRAIDLFNHGYYWESHEAWETVWHDLGRSNAAAAFIKGLIKLAAAGVKAREGNATGVERHARRAAELFGQADSEPTLSSVKRFGLSANSLQQLAEEVAVGASSVCDDTKCAVRYVMPFELAPHMDE